MNCQNMKRRNRYNLIKTHHKERMDKHEDDYLFHNLLTTQRIQEIIK